MGEWNQPKGGVKDILILPVHQAFTRNFRMPVMLCMQLRVTGDRRGMRKDRMGEGHFPRFTSTGTNRGECGSREFHGEAAYNNSIFSSSAKSAISESAQARLLASTANRRCQICTFFSAGCSGKAFHNVNFPSTRCVRVRRFGEN
jgi:hypothetical protein